MISILTRTPESGENRRQRGEVIQQGKTMDSGVVLKSRVVKRAPWHVLLGFDCRVFV